jgi:hypothetical protein
MEKKILGDLTPEEQVIWVFAGLLANPDVPPSLCKNKRHTNSLCNLQDVLTIDDIKTIVVGGLLL